MSSKPFYNHIAGLRGIAIVLVMLFHLSAEFFPYGYYGVDIFLVISGYLLFLSYNRAGYQLDIKDFAKKKLYRIFPPMIMLVLLTFLAALYFQDCEDIVTTSRTGRYTLLCSANDFLRRIQDDYFAADAVENPFLHMWYLSVTIHLYALFALGCLVRKYVPRNIFQPLLWVVGIASFCYCYSFQLHNLLRAIGMPVWEQYTQVSHYLTMPRVWELLAGGVILMLPKISGKFASSMLAVLGLLAAVVPAVLPCEASSYCVPFVVLGTMLIIRYMPESVCMPVLGNKILLWIGGISFSLYLVHMPIIAFYRVWVIPFGSFGDYCFLVCASFALGYLFWRFVEKVNFKWYTVLIAYCVTLVLCIVGKSTNGFNKILRAELNTIQVGAYDDWEVCQPGTLANCLDSQKLPYTPAVFAIARTNRAIPDLSVPLLQMGVPSTTPSVVLMGDSHAQSAYFGLNQLCRDMNISGAYLSIITLPFWDMEHYGDERYYFNREKGEALMEWLKANPSVTHVVLAQYWRKRLVVPQFEHWDKTVEPMSAEVLENSLREFVKRIHNMGKQVIILGPTPEIPTTKPARYVRLQTRLHGGVVNEGPLSCNREEIYELNKDILPILYKLQEEGLCKVLDAISFIPEAGALVAYKDGKFLMYDDDHLSADGSTALFQHLRPQFEAILEEKSQTAESPAQ